MLIKALTVEGVEGLGYAIEEWCHVLCIDVSTKLAKLTGKQSIVRWEILKLN